jgi:hypothetical protein
LRIVLPVIVIHCSVIAACTPMEWTKPNTDPTATQEDIRQCQQQAKLRAARYPLPHGGSMSTTTAGPRGEVSIIGTPATIQSDDARQEFELMTMCMHQKGYKLESLKGDQKH